ncbi:P2RX3 protein, partial [Circaetus pectoralis]|nr:P2RX3 protein [Circaetus pectoralis]
EKAYQVRDTVIESGGGTKVKGIGRYAGRGGGTADYITPHQGGGVFVVVTKQILTEKGGEGVCPEVRTGLGGGGGGGTSGSGGGGGRCVPYNGTLRTWGGEGWCPPEVDTVDVGGGPEGVIWGGAGVCGGGPQGHPPLPPRPVMGGAENFTLFIKNSIRGGGFGFEKANLPPPGGGGELGRCRFHPE